MLDRENEKIDLLQANGFTESDKPDRYEILGDKTYELVSYLRKL